MVISHNLTAMNAQRQFGLVTKAQATWQERLASGYKINRAADDAAGLSISEKLRRQVRGLTQASLNCQDGISLVQTAEGALNEVHDMLQRMNELSVHAANGTLTSEERQDLEDEFLNLKAEINRVADSVTFNEITLFPNDGSSIYTSSYEINVNNDGTTTVQMLSDAYTVGEVSAMANATAVADYIKNEIPKITKSITDALPSLKGAEDLTIKLDFSYIDGGNGTLAYASYSYYTETGTPVKSSFSVKFDTADFTDSNALAGGDRKDLLDATARHELTHTVMQYTVPFMSKLPTWFKEGAAQVTGGAFSTGWLSGLETASTPADYQAYLKQYTVDSRPYGHGALAVAYASYLAEGSPATVTGSTLTNGLDKILAKLKAGKSLDDAIFETTGKTIEQLKSDVNSGSTAAAAFVRKYAEASKKPDGSFGAGSALLTSLSDGSALMGTVPADGSVATEISAASVLNIQAGAEASTYIEINLFSIGTNSLGLSNITLLTMEDAGQSIDRVKNALKLVSAIRSYFGATQNRLEHSIRNLDNVVENTTAAESSVRDTDMADGMVEYSTKSILIQAGYAMMAQANQSNQGVLNLLR